MPPSDRVVVQQYSFNATTNTAPVSTGVGRREYLYIQNQGLNTMRVQFGKPNALVNDMLIDGLDDFEWPQKVPQGTINILSTLGTSGIIIEGNAPEDGNR